MWVAGPSTTAVLGDWGADVIKLEDRTPEIRFAASSRARWAIPTRASVRRSSSTIATNDLSRLICAPPDGHAFALELIERADVFVTSLRLDAIERMKLDYATLAAKILDSCTRRSTATDIAGPTAIVPPTIMPRAWARSV